MKIKELKRFFKSEFLMNISLKVKVLFACHYSSFQEKILTFSLQSKWCKGFINIIQRILERQKGKFKTTKIGLKEFGRFNYSGGREQ